MYIALYEAVCKMQEKINELVDRMNSFDPTGSTDYVKTVNGLKGDVKLTGDNIPYNQLKTVNKQITDNINEIQTVKQNIADLDLSHVLAGSSAQIQLMQQTTFNSITDSQWTAFYYSGFRVVGVVDSGYAEIQALYLQSTNLPHKPIPIKKDVIESGVSSVNGKSGAVVLTGDDINVSGTSDVKITSKLNELDGEIMNATATAEEAYSPTNTPPYPVTSVNGQTGSVTIPTGGGATFTATEVSGTVDNLGRFNTTATKDNFVNIIPISINNLLVPGWTAAIVDGIVLLTFYNLGGTTPGELLAEGSNVSFWLITHS